MYSSLTSYPAFGTLEDTKEYIERFIDPDYTLHITMAKVGLKFNMNFATVSIEVSFYI